MVWHLRGGDQEPGRETSAVRLIGVTFFALALYLAVESIRDLVIHARPRHPAAGLTVAGAALIVMPGLAVAKRRTGRALGNRTLIADSAETAFCAFTSAATLLGVGLDIWAGWWWAYPLPPSSSPRSPPRKASKPGNTRPMTDAAPTVEAKPGARPQP